MSKYTRLVKSRFLTEDEVRERARQLCEQTGKTAEELLADHMLWQEVYAEGRIAEASTKFKVFEVGDRVRHTITGDEGVVTNPSGYIGGVVSVLWQKAGGCHPASVDMLERIAN